MTSNELLHEILSAGPSSATMPLECRLIFRTLADNLHLVELDTGKLRDLSDVRELCRRMVADLAPFTERAALGKASPRHSVVRQEQLRNWNCCPRCGHVHQGEELCGVDMGGGGICHCELEVAG